MEAVRFCRGLSGQTAPSDRIDPAGDPCEPWCGRSGRSFDYESSRSVPMMPEVLDLLGQLKEREHFTSDGDLVFCSDVGVHLDYYGHLRRYKDALERAGLRAVRFHDLRHVFGSAAITTLDPYAVQSYMGHQHYSTTQRYLHHKPRREDAARLAEAFRAAHGESEPELATAPSAE